MADVVYPLPGAAYRLGAAVASVQFGLPSVYGTFAYDDHLDAVAGAPGGSSATGTGRVRWLNVDRTTGAWSPYPDTELLPPSTGADAFGASVLGIDLAAYEQVYDFSTFPKTSVRIEASGEETLIGAPSSEAGQGRAFVYVSSINNADLGAAGDRSSWTWRHRQTLTPPTPGPIQFGAALAAPKTQPGTLTPWVAVGAPDGEAVYIYARSGTLVPPPLALVQTITPATLNPPLSGVSKFGAALLADDLDRDGTPDLLIGAPGGAAGAVIVVRGDPTGAAPLDPGSYDTTQGTLGAYDQFGASLAAGDLFLIEEDPGDRGVAIGAPEAPGGGGVCVTSVVPTLPGGTITFGATPTCLANPFSSPSAARFGAAVAIANFSPYDTFLDEGPADARVPELAVGATGADDVAWASVFGTSFSVPVDGPEPSTGAVVIFRSAPAVGPIFPAPSGFVDNLRPLGERIFRPVSAGSTGFGASLAVLDTYRSGVPDLLVGAPDLPYSGLAGGGVQLLQSRALNGLDDNPGGLFAAVDSAGETRAFKVVVGTNVNVMSSPETSANAFNLTWRKTVGGVEEICTPFFAPAIELTLDVLLKTAFAYTLGSGPTEMSVVVNLDGEIIDESEATNLEAARLTIEISDAGFGDSDPSNDEITLNVLKLEVRYKGGWANVGVECSPTGNPFVLQRTGDLDVTCD